MPFTTRQIEGERELRRIAFAAGYGPDEDHGDIGAWRDALEDLLVGAKSEVDKHQAGTIDNWGFSAHLHQYSSAFHHMLNGLHTA